jgi:DNA-directed RNA polymerase specialized sigma54-like protein
MTEKSPYQLVEEIIDLVDSHGFTTEDVANVEALKCALNDLIHENQVQQYSEWWETFHAGQDIMEGYSGPF